MCYTRLAENTGRKKVAKNRHLGTIAQICRAISSQLGHISTIEKNLLSSNMSSRCPPQYGELRPTSSWDRFDSLRNPHQISSGFTSWQRYYCTACSSAHQSNFAALNRGRHLCSAGRPSRWALAHILVSLWFRKVFFALHVLLILGITCLIQLLMLTLLMDVKHV